LAAVTIGESRGIVCSLSALIRHPRAYHPTLVPTLSRLLVHALGVVTLCVALAAPAGADEPGESAPKLEAPAKVATPERPWAIGVSESAQQEALALFEEGNKLFETSQHLPALAKYRDALKVWDHPAIRYNAAVALINLDQPLGANENLELALKYGAAPFSADTYQQALTYQKLLHGQLVSLTITCDESSAEITIDGGPLFIAPGEVSRWVLPGSHQIVVRKAGYLTETRSLTLLPGKPASERLVLRELRSLPPRTVRRWATWRPWAVVGAGLLVGLAGVPFLLQAKSDINAYDAKVYQLCPMGCPASMIPQSAYDSRDRGHTENIVAISLFSVGGVAAASGVAMAILNLPRIVPGDDASHLSAAPLLGPGTLGLSIALRR
jgi:hypothetical protein